MTVPCGAPEIEGALADLAAALEAGEAARAATFATTLDEACRAATLRGVQLDRPTLDRALRLLLRCEKEAGRMQQTIKASLLQVGTTRRATDAYRPR